jgi:hypothetical protein
VRSSDALTQQEAGDLLAGSDEICGPALAADLSRTERQHDGLHAVQTIIISPNSFIHCILISYGQIVYNAIIVGEIDNRFQNKPLSDYFTH